MKTKILFICFLSNLFSESVLSQNLFSPSIDSLKNLVSSQMIRKYNRELSGDTITTVGGNTVRILSRRTNSPYNQIAAQYIYEKFVSFGLNARYQVNSTTCVNVIATKTGLKYPNKQYIVCSHYDDYSSNSTDTIPGADDNASGTCGVLETARLLSNFNLDYTIKFIAFDEEEDMMIGSYAYADSAYAHGDSIIGVINMDMIGYDGNSTNKYYLVPNNASVFLSSSYFYSSMIYQIPTFPQELISESSASDNVPFLQKGYKALLIMEWTFNPFYHSIQDKFSELNPAYLTNNIKAVLVALASLGQDKFISVRHNPPVSSFDTSARILILRIQSPVNLGTGSNSPRIYYKANSENYISLNAFYSHNDTLKFRIPAQPYGTVVKYYFALQDSAAGVCITSPNGGTGVNPPGTTPPPAYYSYEIYSHSNVCSTTLPKPINDNQITLDTILINQPGYIVKTMVNLSLTHSNDGDLLIQLNKSGVSNISLSQRNGANGQNYINTTFDDSASVSIAQGTPPFTGSFRPLSPLGGLNNQPVMGKYVLRIMDAAAGNTGMLTNWCVLFQYRTSISVQEEEVPVEFNLSQNYPNPFNSSTRINYSIPKNSNVELKIYDMLGREIRTLVSEHQTAGNYMVMFNAGDLASGMYFYKLITGDFAEVKKMLIIK
jgi:subtilisin-like proprotein convertase family protein